MGIADQFKDKAQHLAEQAKAALHHGKSHEAKDAEQKAKDTAESGMKEGEEGKGETQGPW